MNKQTFEKEQEYLIEVLNKIKSDIQKLSKFLNKEKTEIHEEKFETRSHFESIEDSNNAFLDLYLRNIDYEVKQETKYKLQKMLKRPYFARVDVKENDSGNSYYNYIGYRSLEKQNGGFYVIDWRAPYSSLFYDYDKGPFTLVTKGGKVVGDITNKRQYKIIEDKLIYYFDADIKVDDNILQQTLSHNTSDKMRNIVATIQREQNKIIRCSEDVNIVVLGVAGSGKTSIALHRIAYLLYKLKGELNSSEVLILSPNEMFSAYISEVLPELSEEKAINTTFEKIIANELGEKFNFETKQEQIERNIIGKNLVDEHKNSIDFLKDLYNFARDFYSTNFKPNNIKLGQYNIPASKIKHMYVKSYVKFLPYKRIELIIESLMESYFSSFTKLEQKLKQFLRAKLYRMFYNNNPVYAYKKFLHNKSKRFSLISKKIKYEDIIAILFLNFFLYGSLNYLSFKHIVIDEAQDYNAIQLFLISAFFNCTKTIVGDVGQSLNVENSKNNMENIKDIFSIGNSEHSLVDFNKYDAIELLQLRLNKSYRSSYQITNLANSIINRQDCEAIERVSGSPELFGINSKEQLIDKLNILFENYNQKGYNNIGIITKTLKESLELYQILKDDFSNIKLFSNSDANLGGAIILNVFMSKGLEFDAVILFDVSSNNYNSASDKQLLYVAITRALHDICLIHTNKPSNFLLDYFKIKED